LKETVIEGETGYLHEAGDAEALANDVEKMEQQGTEGRLKMGDNGRSWLLENASPADWLESFSGILREARDES
jgi:hypothetical protein